MHTVFDKFRPSTQSFINPWRKQLNKVEEAITAHWGERCPDHEPGCPTCDAWAEYDKAQHDLAEAHYLLKRCRAVLNMAGYYDMVEMLDKVL